MLSMLFCPHIKRHCSVETILQGVSIQAASQAVLGLSPEYLYYAEYSYPDGKVLILS